MFCIMSLIIMPGIARSPVYSHLSTTLQGLPTIRAFRRQNTATEHFHNFQNEHTQVTTDHVIHSHVISNCFQAWYLHLVTTRWLGIRVDSISALFITAVSFISIGLVTCKHHGSFFFICCLQNHAVVSDRSLIGLSITYAISLSGMFQYVIRLNADVENLVSLGRFVLTRTKLLAYR